MSIKNSVAKLFDLVLEVLLKLSPSSQYSCPQPCSEISEAASSWSFDFLDSVVVCKGLCWGIM